MNTPPPSKRVCRRPDTPYPFEVEDASVDDASIDDLYDDIMGLLDLLDPETRAAQYIQRAWRRKHRRRKPRAIVRARCMPPLREEFDVFRELSVDW